MKLKTLLFAGLLSFNGFSAVKLSKQVFKDVPFSPLYLDSGALIMNIDYPSVNALIPQLNKIYGIKLEDRKEAHITVITPPEGQGWGLPEGFNGINTFYSATAIKDKYKDSIQSTKYEIKCVGRQVEGDKQVFYLVINSPKLYEIRAEIYDEALRSSVEKGGKLIFNSAKYYPHITIGFVGGDIHGVSKGPETCVQDLTFID